jgi:hypothetical protein
MQCLNPDGLPETVPFFYFPAVIYLVDGHMKSSFFFVCFWVVKNSEYLRLHETPNKKVDW